MTQEEQDDIQENTDSLEEKLEALKDQEFNDIGMSIGMSIKDYKSELRKKILSMPTYGQYLIKEDVFKLIDEV